MGYNICYRALVEDETVLHKDDEVEQLEHLRGRLVDRAQYSSIRLCNVLKEGVI